MAELISSAEREALLRAARPARGLPVIQDSRSHKRLPLASESRPVDRRFRPNYAVWELTLACDLACRHCGSRAGRERPDELGTAEAIDLVEQMRDLGVKEVALIGGEAYLHDGWLDVIRAIRRCGMQSTLVTGGRGMAGRRRTTGAVPSRARMPRPSKRSATAARPACR
jgi:hypothetical protein